MTLEDWIIRTDEAGPSNHYMRVLDYWGHLRPDLQKVGMLEPAPDAPEDSK